MLPHMKYEGKEASSQVLVQRKGAEVGLARLKKALKRKYFLKVRSEWWDLGKKKKNIYTYSAPRQERREPVLQILRTALPPSL